MTNWSVVELGSVCQIVNGGTPKSEVNKYWGGSNQWITPKDMGRLQGKYVDETERQITDAGLQNCSAKLSPPLSVILSSRAPIGHLAINLQPMATNQGCKTLIPSPKIDHLYLYYFLTHSKQLLNDLGSGTTFKELSSTKLSAVPIPLPPLPVQKAIVAKLDAAFASIDTAIAAAERNAENAKQLFQSYLSDVFERDNDDWTYAKLGDVCDFKGGSQPPKSNFIYEPRNGYVRFLQIRDFGSDKNITYIPVSKKNNICSEDDIMIGRYGASVGKILTGKAGAYNVALMKVTPNTERLSRKWLFHYLTSNVFQQSLSAVASRSAQDGFSKDDIHNFTIPIPPPAQQRELMVRLDEINSQVRQLAVTYNGKASSLSSLKQSFLQQAYGGQLVDAQR